MPYLRISEIRIITGLSVKPVTIIKHSHIWRQPSKCFSSFQFHPQAGKNASASLRSTQLKWLVMTLYSRSLLSQMAWVLIWTVDFTDSKLLLRTWVYKRFLTQWPCVRNVTSNIKFSNRKHSQNAIHIHPEKYGFNSSKTHRLEKQSFYR